MILDTETIVEGAYLEVCPPTEAVEWLKRSREGAAGRPALLRDDNAHQERILYQRNDGYIEFGLARYGVNEDIARAIFPGANQGIRCTILAHFPNGGFARFQDRFALDASIPTDTQELCALFSNPSLADDLFIKCFSRKPPFDALSDEQFESILVVLGKNSRLSTPYDDSFLDGYSDYSYHNVFTAAWQLAGTAPVTPRWANVLYYLLNNCQPPRSMDPRPMIQRWYFKPGDDGIDAGYYLRARLADLLAADKVLLASRDPALRCSFYRRFRPAGFPDWFRFAEGDSEHFLDSAMHNLNLWRTTNDRETLRQLSWSHPDPRSDLMMVNQFNGVERRMRAQHLDWFND